MSHATPLSPSSPSSPSSASSSYKTPLHRRALFGCVLASLVLLAMEGVHLNTDFGAFLTPSSWRLATLYAGAPLVALLCGLGLVLDFTLSLKGWGLL